MARMSTEMVLLEQKMGQRKNSNQNSANRVNQNGVDQVARMSNEIRRTMGALKKRG